MYDTFKLLYPYTTTFYLCDTMEQLSLLYKACNSERILASAFCKVVKLISKINDEFFGLDDADMQSWSLEKLEMCLRTYDESKGVKFITYFGKVYHNKLREETEKLNYKKRKCILENINDIIDIGITDTYNLLTMILPKNLTEKEKTYCILASQGYDNSFIADTLGVSRMTISNIRKSLNVKCADLQN